MYQGCIASTLFDHTGEAETQTAVRLIGGYARVTTAAQEDGSTLETTEEGIDHELVTFDQDIVIKEPGYVYIYYSNENETNALPAEAVS